MFQLEHVMSVTVHPIPFHWNVDSSQSKNNFIKTSLTAIDLSSWTDGSTTSITEFNAIFSQRLPKYVCEMNKIQKNWPPLETRHFSIFNFEWSCKIKLNFYVRTGRKCVTKMRTIHMRMWVVYYLIVFLSSLKLLDSQMTS